MTEGHVSAFDLRTNRDPMGVLSGQRNKNKNKTAVILLIINNGNNTPGFLFSRFLIPEGFELLSRTNCLTHC